VQERVETRSIVTKTLHGAAAALVPLFQDGELPPSAQELDGHCDGLVEELRSAREFRGDACQVMVIPTFGRVTPRRVALVGLGKRTDFSVNGFRLAVSAACRQLGKRGLLDVSLDVADVPLEAAAASEAAAEAAELSRFDPAPYRTSERRESRIRSFEVSGGAPEALEAGAARGYAKNLARELVNEPGNLLGPEELAVRAAETAAAVGLEVEILDVPAMERLKMGALLAVTRGTSRPARLILLRHRGKEGAPLLALVGKAVTFDTGGISIKPAAEMGRMKGDMAGGAAVLGAMQAIAELGVEANVVGLIPAVENMPDGSAWRPGDVVTAMSGKTIETITTDAEGRMLLADAMCYARTLDAAYIVDIATLTGGCVIALGHAASGLFGTDNALIEAVKRCGEAAGEQHWPMPLFPEYREQIKGEIADLKNSGGRGASAATAAAFLKEFAGDTPWAHLDIAGSAQYEKAKPWAPAGPTGIGVGTFVNLARALADGSFGAGG
jgi:leucyl aminopeptidase